MAPKLHVTNGDSIVPEIEAVAPDDPVLPWRDIPHEGPAPGGMDDSLLRSERAAFVARHGWGDGVVLLELFERRDQKLLRAADERDIWLWFEDDLYDQLQLLQILDMLARRVAPGVGGVPVVRSAQVDDDRPARATARRAGDEAPGPGAALDPRRPVP